MLLSCIPPLIPELGEPDFCHPPGTAGGGGPPCRRSASRGCAEGGEGGGQSRAFKAEEVAPVEAGTRVDSESVV